MTLLLIGFVLGVLATICAALGWLAYQGAMIEREQNMEAFHQAQGAPQPRDPRLVL